MGLTIYNSLTRRKEALETLEPGRVRMYVCGPTVYAKAHVGHAMSSVVFDVIRRYLQYRGYEVTHVMNYTDVEDKIIQRANELGTDPMVLAEGYVREYEQHLRDLNVLPPTITPRASQEIETIVGMIQRLIEKDYAYAVDGDVYFRVSRDEDYGRLSGRRLEEKRDGLRLALDDRKEDAADFALWKSAKPGEPAWDSPWGLGRPGWHIECSAMNLRYLGEQIDLHGGGTDLIFPHHENEIAQTESATGRLFARYWVHNGMLQLSGEKMSKSLGNLVGVDEFLQKNESDVFRMMVLNGSYRGPLTFNDEVVEQARGALERLRGALRHAPTSAPGNAEAEEALSAATAKAKAGFESSMDDDFNTAGALSHLFELVRAIHQARDVGARAEAVRSAQSEMRYLAGVLGLRLEERKGAGAEAEAFIELLVEVRRELRQLKQWKLADWVRDRLGQEGILLEDGPEGTTWRPA